MLSDTARADLIQGVKVGMLCGLWLGTLAILNLVKDLEQSLFEYAAELLLYLAVYPALITIVLVVALFHHDGSRLIAGISGGISSYLIANFLIQIAFMILQSANDLQITFEFSEVLSVGTVINGAMLGVLVAFAFRIPSTEFVTVPTDVSADEDGRPAKPTWDPRIESLKQDLHATKMDLYQVKTDVWGLLQRK